MSDAPSPDALSPEEALRLHRRLCDGVRTAPAEFAAAVLPGLIAWLAGRFPRDDPDLREDAAEEAVMALILAPEKYDLGRGELIRYLRMAADRDLRNLRRRERRHRHRDLDSVEHSPSAGKYLGRDDDPSLRLRVAEQAAAADTPALATIRAELTEPERRALDLMRRRERSTDAFAEVLGLADRPAGERRRAVKQVKDKIKQRLKRAGVQL